MNPQDQIHVLSRGVIIDHQHILLCQTLHLDVNFYFLPGGHIKEGESVKHALLRELKEETNVECQIKRFLGCLEYSFEPEHRNICHHHEYNFIFEAESLHLSFNQKVICPEDSIDLVWIEMNDLDNIDLRAKPLKQYIPIWLAQHANTNFISEMI